MLKRLTVVLSLFLLSGCSVFSLLWEKAVTGDPTGDTIVVVHDGWVIARESIMAEDVKAIRACILIESDKQKCLTVRCVTDTCITFKTVWDPAIVVLYEKAVKAHDADSKSPETITAVKSLASKAGSAINWMEVSEPDQAERLKAVNQGIEDSVSKLLKEVE